MIVSELNNRINAANQQAFARLINHGIEKCKKQAQMA